MKEDLRIMELKSLEIAAKIREKENIIRAMQN